ncbi:MAG TPA: hypothetical protein VFH56_05305, partial [Acidimicrobiales bacterium]|nr:hypothetical protein [Acidimicrobiales bacterium]
MSLTKTGKTKGAIEGLILTTVGLSRDNPLTSAGEVAEAVDAYFGITIDASEVQRAIDVAIQRRTLIRASRSTALMLGPAPQAELDVRIADSRALEAAVRDEWSIELRAGGYASDEDGVSALWSCLRSYMAAAFRQHGALAVELLDANLSQGDSDQESLGACLDAAIRLAGLEQDRDNAAEAVRSFFKTTTTQRARYVVQLLDATFTFFALTVNEATADFLNQSLKPLDLFLDTNFIFGLLGIHENPLSEASRELVSFVRSHNLPFKLYVHERTLKEIDATMSFVAERLVGRRWTPELSRAALLTKTGTGVELAYHRLNAQSPVDPKIYLSKFDHIPELLADHGVKVYRVPPTEELPVKEKALLVAEYKHFVESRRPGKPKAYETIDHDICVWMSLQSRRRSARTALDAGALFLTNDVLFHHFDWRVLRKD